MKRESGVLLPVFSLPGDFGCGGFSCHARDFIDRIAAAGFTLWQVLPMGFPDAFHSPYMSLSSFGGNPYFIDPEELYEQGLVTEAELDTQRIDAPWQCDYERLEKIRMPFLLAAASRLPKSEIESFFDREPLVARFCRFLEGDTLLHGGVQLFFHRQWEAIRAYAKQRGVTILGDLPFYVSADSFDVAAFPEAFQLEGGKLCRVAGVPPDYFSPEGQRWGNPLYHWENMKKDGFAYFKERLGYQLRLFDGIRIDHFRAISAYYSIPAEREDGLVGEWIDGPKMDLIDAMNEVAGDRFLLAEDLGLIDSDTRALLAEAGYPGMAVFQFGFDGNPLSPHLPHNYKENLVAYSGTHDNNTLLGWLYELDEDTRGEVMAYLGHPADGMEGALTALLASKAAKVIFPLQDLLGFGADTRTNTPGKAEGNWKVRFTAEQIASLDGALWRARNRRYARGL